MIATFKFSTGAFVSANFKYNLSGDENSISLFYKLECEHTESSIDNTLLMLKNDVKTMYISKKQKTFIKSKKSLRQPSVVSIYINKIYKKLYDGSISEYISSYKDCKGFRNFNNTLKYLSREDQYLDKSIIEHILFVKYKNTRDKIQINKDYNTLQTNQNTLFFQDNTTEVSNVDKYLKNCDYGNMIGTPSKQVFGDTIAINISDTENDTYIFDFEKSIRGLDKKINVNDSINVESSINNKIFIEKPKLLEGYIKNLSIDLQNLIKDGDLRKISVEENKTSTSNSSANAYINLPYFVDITNIPDVLINDNIKLRNSFNNKILIEDKKQLSKGYSSKIQTFLESKYKLYKGEDYMELYYLLGNIEKNIDGSLHIIDNIKNFTHEGSNIQIYEILDSYDFVKGKPTFNLYNLEGSIGKINNQKIYISNIDLFSKYYNPKFDFKNDEYNLLMSKSNNKETSITEHKLSGEYNESNLSTTDLTIYPDYLLKPSLHVSENFVYKLLESGKYRLLINKEFEKGTIQKNDFKIDYDYNLVNFYKEECLLNVSGHIDELYKCNTNLYNMYQIQFEIIKKIKGVSSNELPIELKLSKLATYKNDDGYFGVATEYFPEFVVIDGSEDELLIPKNGFDYNIYKDKIFGDNLIIIDKGKYVKKYTQEGNQIIELPIENPVDYFANIAIEVINIDVSVMKYVLDTLYNQWRHNIYRYAGIEPEKAIKDLLDSTMKYIGEKYYWDRCKIPHLERTLKLFLWYSEMSILCNSEYEVVYVREDCEIDYSNKTLGNLEKNILCIDNLELTDDFVLSSREKGVNAKLKFKVNQEFDLQLKFKAYMENSGVLEIHIGEDIHTFLGDEKPSHNIDLKIPKEVKEVEILFFYDNEESFIDIAVFKIKDMFNKSVNIKYLGKLGKTNKTVEYLIDMLTIAGESIEDTQVKLGIQNSVQVAYALDTFKDYMFKHHDNKEKGKRRVIKK
ncbi:TPA: hypothetical protein ACG3PH_000242 [Clostridioides difficile]|uniref:hypothetical protein n=1 Tax=Clostridioides difficile TaxID=1496 RepID=UPI000E57FEF4|nr:hypothetical protein [Clostridioides difficile]AXU72314.1 hypothetical protein CDIF28668_02411 [Clostridioides difficile]